MALCSIAIRFSYPLVSTILSAVTLLSQMFTHRESLAVHLSIVFCRLIAPTRSDIVLQVFKMAIRSLFVLMLSIPVRITAVPMRILPAGHLRL